MAPLKIEYRDPASLTPNPRNPRKIDKAIPVVAKSVKEFGFNNPILLDKDGQIIAGHVRLKAALDLGLKQVPTLTLSHLNPHEAAAFGIADNKAAEHALWDEELLAVLLKELDGDGIDVDWKELGFSNAELMQLAWEDPETAGADAVPDPPKKAVTRKGDLWKFGNHRLLCGDSTDEKDVRRLMGKQKAVMCQTDPPYAIEYTGSRIVGGRNAGKDWSAQYKDFTALEMRQWIEVALLFTHPTAAWYQWCAGKTFLGVLKIWEEVDLKLHQEIIWVKPSPIFGHSLWWFAHESCLFGWIRKPRTIRETEMERSTTVWDVSYDGGGARQAKDHPTQKPVELFIRPIRKHTHEGDLLYEPFSGSGTQIIAAETTNRVCRAIEIEPTFCDVAIERWENLTGKKAKRAKP